MDNHIKQNFQQVLHRIEDVCNKCQRNSSDITLVAVTKTRPLSVVQSVLDCDCHHIGENRVQEIEQKIPCLVGAKTIHMIGHLQSNKVSKIVPLVDWIHSIDSEKLLSKVNQYCEKNNKKMNILIQVNTSQEHTKSGCEPEFAPELAECTKNYSHILFRGFMTIGPLYGSEKDVRESFQTLRKLAERCQFLSDVPLELSMGMSDDFPVAIEEGSTMIRLGTILLGNRGK